MKEIICTRGMKAIVDDEFYPILNMWNWHTAKKGYAVRGSNILPKFKNVFMHSVIVYMVFGDIPDGYFVDHINGNKMDNRTDNLRLVTFSQNRVNVGKPRNKTSVFKGVNKENGKWIARVMKDRKMYSLGRFDTEIEAALAYNKKATELHGEFVRLNVL